jgi:FixJ family two-component response regulator
VARLHEIACLIADVRMPKMRGFELHRQIAASGHIIPTSAVSARLSSQEISCSQERLLARTRFGPATM